MGLLLLGAAFSPAMAMAQNEQGNENRSFHGMMPFHWDENTTQTITKTADGINISITTKDPAKLEELHTHADMMAEKIKMKELKNTISKDIKNLENGVQVTLTSTNPEAVTLLQNKKQPSSSPFMGSGDKDVTVSKQNITNGIQTTITTTNKDKVAGIQKRATNEGEKMGRKEFRHQKREKKERYQE